MQVETLHPARSDSHAGIVAVAVVLGLGWGATTSGLQTVLPSPFGGLANAVAPWLMAPFVVGTFCRSLGTAAVLGLLTCLLQVPGYYVTADLRGFPVGSAYVLVWSAAAVVGGPVFGVAGRLLRSGQGRLRGLAPALVGGVWLAEGIATYAIVLGYYGDAIVFGVVGVVLFLSLSRRGRAGSALLWLLVVLPSGVGANLLLHVVLTGGGAPQ